MKNQLLEVKLPKYTVYLKPKEIEQLLIKEPDLWEKAVKRGKEIKRNTERENRRKLTTSTVFCLLCGSELVDVNGWESSVDAVFICSNCGHRANVKGFTIGKVRRTEFQYIQEALKDVAVYNKCPWIKDTFLDYWKEKGLKFVFRGI